jgi:hypothetical protein
MMKAPVYYMQSREDEIHVVLEVLQASLQRYEVLSVVSTVGSLAIQPSDEACNYMQRSRRKSQQI